ncbi:MAG TPA: hypothetical protein VKV39_00440 [Candidatus Sulfotelmatobacter sp.]|nr:hypothetical protein [Candidatus Sulfotelmatobacter sp.]
MKTVTRLRSPLGGMLSVWALALIPTAYAQVSLDDFHVTNGKIENSQGRLSVSTKEMRAVLKYQTRQDVTVKFTYQGPTAQVSRLGSGEVRTQFGIKLRAQDNCNIVYVMWHFAPDTKIAVSVKRNPGESTHEQCLDLGYITKFKPRVSAQVAAIRPGQPHKLRASMKGSNLMVAADDRTVWEGDLGPVALQFDGPVGVRSDNARVNFDFFATK